MQVALSRKQQSVVGSSAANSHTDIAGQVIPIFDEEYCTENYLLDTLRHRFTLNNESHFLGSDIDWRHNPSRDVEWHILLHKFYCAPGLARRFAESGDERYLDCFQYLVSSWISQTPVGFIAADVTARRVQNWIYAWQLFASNDPRSLSQGFLTRMLESLVAQVEYVCSNLAVSRNHRTLELYAIFLASVALPSEYRSEHWRKFAIAKMCSNIEEDLTHDGVHCERSTDYHHIVLRSYLLFFRIASINRIALPSAAMQKVSLALDFSMHVHRPDGEIPALSDSDSKSFLQLLDWGARLFDRADFAFVASSGDDGDPPKSQHRVFAEGGYAILRSPWQRGKPFKDARFLVFDCGPIGVGNHGHLDALSIEVAAYGQPLVVDPGRYTYDEQGDYNWRAHFRGTSAHNTVTIDDCEQAIYRQSGARRKIFEPHPTCSLLASELSNDLAYLHGVVHGPNYRAVHHRHIWFIDNSYWLILDRLVASEQHKYELRFQLTANFLGELNFLLHESATEVVGPGFSLFIAQAAPSVTLEAGFVSSRYGEKEAAPRICATANAANYGFLSVLYPTNGSTPEIKSQVNASVETSIRIDHVGQSDQWQWCADSGLMLRRSNEGVQSWRLSKAVRHGQ